jgi:geranylgeranyl diphosphate synthase type II
MIMDRKYTYYKEKIESKLKTYFMDNVPQKSLLEAMRYSLLAGGKRIRPIITLAFAEASGGNPDDALDFACALEMVHTYSLIHDDLPCMDNDDLRRGKPTNHIVYGEYTAVLAGDALQSAAFKTMSEAPLATENIVKGFKVLADAAGAYEMCGGQVLDMEGERKKLTLEQVREIHEHKTAAMIKAAAKLGVIAGNGSESQLRAAEKYAGAVGLAFQIRDDVLDATSTTQELGKPVGSDSSNSKTTFYSLLGAENCEKEIIEKTNEAVLAVKNDFDPAEFLIWLANMLAGRRK